ncbi:Ctr copper transporter family-domain-containing protein [Calycina marina]|uniref:Copper transport protein n=1 Tax=Calycina marina TaxID=1763456 RepID=A0A9P7YVP2_9HELO|nr:Ctr copper transporter family-domain-containing protein [Calycina marina]
MAISMAMSMTITTSTTLASPTNSMAMSPSSSDTTMDMDTTMSTVFFTSTHTPLWFSALVPQTTAQYTGICLFVLAFATLFRLILAFRLQFSSSFAAAQHPHKALLSPYTNDEMPRRWNIKETLVIAAMDALVAGVSYLLMLAVMTFNVGYFLSVLGGVFLGSVIFGRFTGDAGAH